MKYYDLKNTLSPLLLFSPADIFLVDPAFRQATLYDWQKAGRVKKLRNNHYLFADFQPYNTDFYLLSNLLYEPSYISTELALNHYGVIPEAVSVITAVTTNKTKSFTAAGRTFSYHSMHPKLFFGYELLQVRDRNAAIASLEKAVLDYLYLHPEVRSIEDFAGLRWNREVLSEDLDWPKLEAYLAIFANKALAKRIKMLRKYLKG